MKKTFIGTMAAMTFVAALVLVPAIASGNPPAAPITMDHDCETGALWWEYRNDHPAPVTIKKQRIVLPEELGFHRDTTLHSWNITLGTGEAFDTGITGIIYIEEGQKPSDGSLTAMPDGKYVNHMWLTDGVVNWFVKQAVSRNCGVEAIPGAASLSLEN